MKTTKTYLLQTELGGYSKEYKSLKTAIKVAKSSCFATYGTQDFYVYDNETGELIFSTDLKDRKKYSKYYE